MPTKMLDGWESDSSGVGDGTDALAKRIAEKAETEIREIIRTTVKKEVDEANLSAEMVMPPALCTVESIGKYYVFTTAEGERAILVAGCGVWRLLMLIANFGTSVSLENLFHADRRKGPFRIAAGDGGLVKAGCADGGYGVMSYKVLDGPDGRAVREVLRALEKNRAQQDAASADEEELAKLQEEEHALEAWVKQYRIPDSTDGQEDAKPGATERQIHAAYMSVTRAIDGLHDTAPSLARHLKDNVKVNGTIRYEKVIGWDWTFLFPVPVVNLLAADLSAPVDADDSDEEGE